MEGNNYQVIEIISIPGFLVSAVFMCTICANKLGQNKSNYPGACLEQLAIYFLLVFVESTYTVWLVHPAIMCPYCWYVFGRTWMYS